MNYVNYPDAPISKECGYSEEGTIDNAVKKLVMASSLEVAKNINGY